MKWMSAQLPQEVVFKWNQRSPFLFPFLYVVHDDDDAGDDGDSDYDAGDDDDDDYDDDDDDDFCWGSHQGEHSATTPQGVAPSPIQL